jgi:hypothetical protein
MAANYQEKVLDLDQRYNIGLQQHELKPVIAKLSAAKAHFTTDQEWVSALESVVMSIRSNPLEMDAKRQALAESQLCPVCNQAGDMVTLMGGREVAYCESHRVVSPLVKETQE